MNRSMIPDGILVDRTVLEYTELSKIEEILRSRVDWTSRGVFSGGAVTVGVVDPTRVDVAPFSGFAPNGEFLECTGNLLSIQLDSAVLGDVNYVCAFYTETQSRRQPHETDGDTYATRATRSYRVRVYEESNFLALPSTDANLANDARDRALLLAKVTGNGVGVNLTSSNLFGPTTYNNILYADPLVPLLISGVTITGVSPDTSVGTGTLAYTWAAGPIYGLQWTSFSGGAGAVVNPTVDGTYSLFDGTGVAYITVSVVISQLSTTTPLSDSIEIINMYDQDIPRQTAEDYLHRNMIGSGTPTPNNPHGLTQDDLGGSDLGQLQEHQDVMHSNGIWRGSSDAIFLGGISTLSPAGDILSLISPAAGDLYYINGRKLSDLSPTSFQFIPSVIPSATGGTHFYEVSVDDDEISQVTLKMSFPDPRAITGCWIVNASEAYPVGGGTGTLALQVINAFGTDYYRFTWESGEQVTVNSTQENQVIRLYAANSSDWIEIYVNIQDAVASADGNLPGVGVYADLITIYASVDWNESLPILNIAGWWNAAGAPARFQIGIPPYSAGTRTTTDKRSWGNLSESEVTDAGLQYLTYASEDELHYSGVLYARRTIDYDFAIYNAVALSMDLRGGGYYCRGERIDFQGQTAITLYNNATNLVYMDTAGSAQVIDVTSDFAGSVSNALRYVVGGAQDVPSSNIDRYPERGVALYEIRTAGGVVTDTINLMRNLNGPVDPWSVAQFTTLDLPVSAFDSLYSCFLYIGVCVEGGSYLEVKLTGTSYINEPVTQPQGVKVVGVSPTTAIHVQINDVSATGSWGLSQGCVVEGVFVLQAGNTGVAISPASYTKVVDCRYMTSAADADVFVYSANALTDVRVEGCYVATRSGAVVLTNAGNSNIRVCKNIITQSANNSGFGWGLITVSGDVLHVTRNNITTDNSVDFTTAIQMGVDSTSTLDHVYVSDNSVLLGEGSGVASEYAIRFIGNDPRALWVSGNSIGRVVGSVSMVGVGLQVIFGTGVTIRDNYIASMGVGIQILNYDGVSLSTGTVQNFEIYKNNIQGGYHRGIDIEGDSAATGYNFWGINVEGNRITKSAKGAGGVLLWGNDLYGIRFSVGLSGSGKTAILEGISVRNNLIDNLTNSIEGTLAIYLGVSAGAMDAVALYGLLVSSNAASYFYGADTFATVGIGIYISNVDVLGGCSVEDNTLTPYVTATDPTSDVYGIYSTLNSLTLSGNTVLLLGSAPSNPGTGIYSMGSLCSILNNVITALQTGIYFMNSGTSCSGNTIKSYAVGICVDGGLVKSSLIGNKIDVVYAANPNPYGLLAPFPNGNYCVLIGSADQGYLLSDNLLIISGAGLGQGSACVYADDSDQFSIKGNETYLSVAASTPEVYHFYISVDDDAVGDISGNTVHNRQAALANGICVDNAGGATSVSVTVSGNTIFAIREDDVVNWATGTGTPYELVNGNFGGGVDQVVYSGNSIQLPTTSVRVPKVLLPGGSSYSVVGPVSPPTNFSNNVVVNAFPGTIVNWW